jgi:hypothetical protein
MTLYDFVIKWENLACKKSQDAEQETEPMGKRLIEHCAVCYFNFARHLRQVLHSRDMSFNFKLKILQEDTK